MPKKTKDGITTKPATKVTVKYGKQSKTSALGDVLDKIIYHLHELEKKVNMMDVTYRVVLDANPAPRARKNEVKP